MQLVLFKKEIKSSYFRLLENLGGPGQISAMALCLILLLLFLLGRLCFGPDLLLQEMIERLLKDR